MFRKRVWNRIATATILFISSSSSFGIPLEIDASTAKLTFETKAELDYSDNGFEKIGDRDPTKTIGYHLLMARFNLAGEVNESVSYRVRYNALKSDIEYGYVKLEVFGSAYLLAGKTKLLQGGWYQLKSGVDKMMDSFYLSKLKPFSSYQPVVEIGAKAFGVISLQLTDDVTTDGKGKWNKERIQPAVIAAWTGDLGILKPLLQYGSYDLNHSQYFVVGLAGEFAGLAWSLDHVVDQRSLKIEAVGSEDAEEEIGTITSTTLDLSYEVKDLIRPFLTYSRLEYAQAPNDSDANGYDDEGIRTINDNGWQLALGTFIETYGKKVRPYVSYAYASGGWFETATSDQTETVTESSFHLGVAAKI